MLRELARKIDRAQDAFGRALAWVMLVLVLVVFTDVVLRYLFQLTYVWTQELSWYLFSIAYLMGAGYVMLWDEHVRVDILYSRLSPRGKAWLDMLRSATSLISGQLNVADGGKRTPSGPLLAPAMPTEQYCAARRERRSGPLSA